MSRDRRYFQIGAIPHLTGFRLERLRFSSDFRFSRSASLFFEDESKVFAISDVDLLNLLDMLRLFPVELYSSWELELPLLKCPKPVFSLSLNTFQ